jgi:atypical dual specificity phosphatase
MLFWPTLLWNVGVVRVFRYWDWWNLIDEGLWLGALPLAQDVARLHAAGVRAVINLCAETRGPVGAYSRFGVEQLHLPTTDFNEPPIEHVRQAVDYIARKRAAGAGVYLHCKAGRGRSATVAACWLMHSRQIDPAEAQRVLTACRRQVARDLASRKVVRSYWASVNESNRHD